MKTWRSALRDANKLIESGDRVHLASALYLLLEIIWLDPRGCNLATMYLDTGSIYLAFDHLEEAAKAYRNCLRLDYFNWKARYNLGLATARLQDFVEATRQLKLALKACPIDIAEEITKILKEIDQIQYSKNLRAYKDATKARVFTTQILESQNVISGKLGVPNLPEDHTISHRNGLALSSSTPHLLDVSHEWQGGLASVLHRLHAFARLRHIDIQPKMLRLNPTRTDGISVQALDELVARVTGIPLSMTERSDLTLMLGNYGFTNFQYLNANAESIHAFNEIQDHGASHALLYWNLYRKRAKRSADSKTGGLWYWFELTMAKWIGQVLHQRSTAGSLDHITSSLIEALFVHGWVTPMDFAWKWKSLPDPDDFPMLQLANRGIFIFECHRARSCIQEEASRTLLMFLRKCIIKCKRRKHSRLLDVGNYQERSVNEAVFLEDIHTQLRNDILLDQQVAQEVLLCIEDMVDDVIIYHRQQQQQKAYEEEVRWQEVPVRTEQRQKIISEVI
ncbi:hypothetical protein AM587_10008366 [Phytophthora nicotianae]|uniref:Uncharacterized protein n=1 Tax=Phytophthora nicotianae TaxID=4792 RepID=A0A0W8C9J4_PHYNI|nr:hypothetical protein AM587_10008366 [Phytophthora nicotianae]